MTLHGLRDAPPAELAAALAKFESTYRYPLGPGRQFRIDHGTDYPRFYRAIGEGDARTFVLTSGGDVRGVLGIAIRPLLMPDGSVRSAAYVGDVKASTGRALVRLAGAADAWARPRVTAAYGVVMDGTAAVPDDYTGRVDIEAFSIVGKILVLRFPTSAEAAAAQPCPAVEPAVGETRYRALCAGRIAPLGGDPSTRSETPPTWLVDSCGDACGRLEDTRRAKRLIACDTGDEMCSAHLACFAFRSHRAAADLLRAALAIAAARGFPSLFAAIPPHDLPGLDGALGDAGRHKVIAPATIYGAGLDTVTAPWIISTSEI